MQPETTAIDLTANNVLLADFMGWEKLKDGRYYFSFFEPEPVVKCPPEQLRFHKYWNWLMPVVEKINSSDTECFVTIWANQCRIHNIYPYKMNDIFFEESSTIDAVFKACVEFVKWCNENPKSN